MIIIRFILIVLITYLLVRGFIQSLYPGNNDEKPEPRKTPQKKRISKNVGEYIDYEEVE